MEPVEQVVCTRVQVHLQLPHARLAIRHEAQLRLRLQPLGLQHLEQPPFGLGVVGLDEIEAFGRLLGRHGLAHQHLEALLLGAPVPQITAVDADGNRVLRCR